MIEYIKANAGIAGLGSTCRKGPSRLGSMYAEFRTRLCRHAFDERTSKTAIAQGNTERVCFIDHLLGLGHCGGGRHCLDLLVGNSSEASAASGAVGTLLK